MERVIWASWLLVCVGAGCGAPASGPGSATLTPGIYAAEQLVVRDGTDCMPSLGDRITTNPPVTVLRTDPQMGFDLSGTVVQFGIQVSMDRAGNVVWGTREIDDYWEDINCMLQVDFMLDGHVVGTDRLRLTERTEFSFADPDRCNELGSGGGYAFPCAWDLDYTLALETATDEYPPVDWALDN